MYIDKTNNHSKHTGILNTSALYITMTNKYYDVNDQNILEK